MNKNKELALTLLGQVEPEKNFFIYYPNHSCSSSRTKLNRVLAYLLKKIVLFDKYPSLLEIAQKLLKYLTKQSFFANYQGNLELKDELAYYHILIMKNPQAYNLFYNEDTPHKYKFKYWLKMLCHLDDEDLDREIQKYQYLTEYLNTEEYQILISLINDSEIDYNKIKNGFVLLKLINQKQNEQKLQLLNQMKNYYINHNYILKKEWLKMTIQLNSEIDLKEIIQNYSVDYYDSEFQSLIIQYLMEKQQKDTALEFILNHLYYCDGNKNIWQMFESLIDEEFRVKYKKDFDYIIKMHFNHKFYRQITNYQYLIEQKMMILCKIKVLILFDQPLAEKLSNFMDDNCSY